MANQADLRSRPKIEAIKNPEAGTTFFSHKGDSFPGLRLAVGARKKTWVLSKRIGASVKSITLGHWPDLPTGNEAWKVAEAKLRELTTGTDAATTKIATLRDAFDAHCRESRADGTLKPETEDNYRLQVKNHLDSIFDMPVERVTFDVMNDLLTKLKSEGKKSTAQHCATLLKMAFRRACQSRENLPNRAVNLKVKGVERKTPKILFDESKGSPALGLILDMSSLVHRTAWLTMLLTGMRSKSVITLNWDQVDLEAKTITLRKMKNGLDRTFPISDLLVTALSALPHRTGWVFPADSRTGHIYSLAALNKVEKVDGKRVETKLLRQHDTRRLFTAAGANVLLPDYVVTHLRGDKITSDQQKMVGHYLTRAGTHAHVNAIADEIIRCNSLSPAFVLERIAKGPDVKPVATE